MSRNLLPRLRNAPNPANIKAAPVGRWSTIETPAELAKVEYADEHDVELRSRVQSIPSPWARLLLFRNALEDRDHPARALVENELLDALEFLWTLGASGVPLDVRRARLEELEAAAGSVGSMRVEDFAQALVELAPRRAAGGGAAGSALASLAMGVVENEPVLASSPYTILFTAESAAGPRTGTFFRYAAGAERRRLHQRPLEFQAYVARVLLPQVSGDAPAARGDHADWQSVQRLVGRWLGDEVRLCVQQARDALKPRVSPPTDLAGFDWRDAALAMGLEPVDAQGFSGVVLYWRRPDVPPQHSRWKLRATRTVPDAAAPFVIDPETFDGRFYDGASPVRLPGDLRGLDHAVLPALGERHPWVAPLHDWLTESLLLLSEPLEPASVKGLAGYRSQRTGDPRFAEARLALPLRAQFFRWFTPDDVDRMLAVEVLPGGSVIVALTVPVGSDDAPEQVVVRRTYDEGHVRRETGPGLAVWPAFQHPRWTDYVLFRTDSTTLLADNMAVEAFSGGRPLAAERVRRTPLVEATALTAPPEVLEIHSTVAGPGRTEPLGVVLPRFRGTDSATQTRWEVGVDFGTSNTVIGIRENEQPAARLFGAAGLMLPLTHTGPGAADLMAAYFFPPDVPERPFGTAVVHMKNLPRLDVEAERLGLRVTVPYSGYVDGYETNRVAGDLKWSRQSHSYFLSASFLRHVVATVLAEAVRHGVDPAHVSFRWAYPRAFSPAQVNQLRRQWQHVMATFAPLGLAGGALREELDESTSALRHFFNAGQVGVAGDMQAILDVGGGTSDLAVYGRNRVLVLDSVILGGRNLTGRRQQAASREMLGNPFVDAFFAWACEHDLPAQARRVVETYLRDGEVHLAFSYLVGTAWFQQGRAALFHADPAFHAFQGIIFYFFASLFYYVGLTARALAPADAPADAPVELPQRVVLAGNGSRYVDWLTDLVPSTGPDVFKRALGRLVAAGAGAPDARAPHVERSDKPKEEVARGLVALVETARLDDEGAALSPVIGERLVAGGGAADGERRLEITSRFATGEVVDQAWAAGMRWVEGEMEIERFHAALLDAVAGVGSYGEQWPRIQGRYREFFQSLDRRDLQEETRRRLEYQSGLESGFRGSIFLLEATAVLDLMRDAFFRR